MAPLTKNTNNVPILFVWPHGGKQVYLTGTFDDWKVSIPMKRESRATDEFVAVVNLDPSKKWFFKFVVDGIWRCSVGFPTECDPSGNVNNWRIPADEADFKNMLDDQSQQPLKLSKSREKLTEPRIPSNTAGPLKAGRQGATKER